MCGRGDFAKPLPATSWTLPPRFAKKKLRAFAHAIELVSYLQKVLQEGKRERTYAGLRRAIRIMAPRLQWVLRLITHEDSGGVENWNLWKPISSSYGYDMICMKIMISYEQLFAMTGPKEICRCCFTLGACIHAKELAGKALQDIQVFLKGKVFGHDFTIVSFAAKIWRLEVGFFPFAPGIHFYWYPSKCWSLIHDPDATSSSTSST